MALRFRMNRTGHSGHHMSVILYHRGGNGIGMGQPTAEFVAERAFDLGLLNERQLKRRVGDFRKPQRPVA